MKQGLAIVFVILLALSAFSAAQTIEGTVVNRTNGKPAAGADVVLISLMQGMTESARAKADASGHFTLKLDNANAPHLVRVNHQGVNYFKMAPPGTGSVEVPIYDSAKKLDSISTTVDVIRYQSDGSTLQVLELFAVKNDSMPPRTLGGDRTFEVVLPDGAVVDEGSAKAPGGQPIQSPPVPVEGKKNHYSFTFPLRPGETQLQIGYHLPYGGSLTIKPTALNAVQHFVVMMPKSMSFSPANAARFASMDDPNSTIQVATNVKAGEALAYTVAGSGTLVGDENGGAPAQQQGGGAMAAETRGPGGGIGKPIDTPDPLSTYRWPLLGVLAGLLALGGVYVAVHKGDAEPIRASAPSVPSMSHAVSTASSALPNGRSALLEAMKEELFQLEVDRQQGRVSDDEYQKAKAGLDLAIKRAVSRS